MPFRFASSWNLPSPCDIRQDNSVGRVQLHRNENRTPSAPTNRAQTCGGTKVPPGGTLALSLRPDNIVHNFSTSPHRRIRRNSLSLARSALGEPTSSPSFLSRRRRTLPGNDILKTRRRPRPTPKKPAGHSAKFLAPVNYCVSGQTSPS